LDRAFAHRHFLAHYGLLLDIHLFLTHRDPVGLLAADGLIGWLAKAGSSLDLKRTRLNSFPRFNGRSSPTPPWWDAPFLNLNCSISMHAQPIHYSFVAIQ
jgi:hypothetical protein